MRCSLLLLGYFLAMLTEGQVYVLNAGDSASLDCMFHADAYNLFDYPVLWRKTQRDEETQVGTLRQFLSRPKALLLRPWPLSNCSLGPVMLLCSCS